MSKNGNIIGAFLIGLLLGAFFGAVLALLYAPEAGEDLRLKIQSGVETNLEKANLELERVKQTIPEKAGQSQTQEESPAPLAEG
jgi:gas vesicle protein